MEKIRREIHTKPSDTDRILEALAILADGVDASVSYDLRGAREAAKAIRALKEKKP